MRNSVKKAAVTALVCVTAAGMMAGCGNKKLDGTKIAVTVNKQEIPLGVVSILAAEAICLSGVPKWMMIPMRLTVKMR